MRTHEVDTDIEFPPGGGKGKIVITVHETDQRIEVPLHLSKQAIVELLAVEISKAHSGGASHGVEVAVKDCINTLVRAGHEEAAEYLIAMPTERM